jgi:hypothetical protein
MNRERKQHEMNIMIIRNRGNVSETDLKQLEKDHTPGHHHRTHQYSNGINTHQNRNLLQ